MKQRTLKSAFSVAGKGLQKRLWWNPIPTWELFRYPVI